MSVNFDAKLSLDISQFLSGVKKAEGALKSLEAQIGRINSRNLSLGAGGGALGASAGSSISRRRAEAALEQSLVEKMTKTEMNNAKVQWQSEMMRQKAMDARLKDHQTMSSLFDQQIMLEQKGRRDASNAIKAQMQESARAREASVRGLARDRYALYDVAAAYTAVAGAASLVATATAGTAINFERAFVDVERTTDFVSAKIGAAAESAKNDLKSLAAEIPVAFGQITQIATIGNQLGIAQGSLTSFTETVAKFSATTGITVEATAMAFGRIGELLGVPAQEFDRLGSAIAFAGVNAVATEEQILSVTKEIATTAKMAKFSSADIVGLSTALSSLGIAPEAARGSIIRTFAGINKVISEGGVQLEQYAAIAGMSAEQFSATWQRNGQEAFDALLAGLQNLSNNGENLDSVLRALGMRNVRDIQTIQKLGDNYEVYASSIRDANQGFNEGTFLSQSYGKIQETVASKLLLVQNNIANLLDTLGQSAVGDVFKGILDAVNNTLITLNQFARTPVGQGIGVLVTVGSAAVAMLAAINAASALAQASIRAFAVAQTSLIGPTAAATAAVAGLNTQLNATGIAGGTAATGLQKGKILVNALNTAFKAVKWLAIITAVTHAITQMGLAFSSAKEKAENLLGGFSGLQDALTADLENYTTALGEFGGDVRSAEKATGVIAGLTTEFENNNQEINKAIESQNTLNELVGLGANNASTLSEEFQTLNFVIGENTRQWVANAIVQSESFKKLSENKDAMQAIIDAGFNLDMALQAAATGNLDVYMDRINQKALQGASDFEQTTSAMYNYGGVLGYLMTLIPRLVNEFTLLFGIDLFPVSSGIDAIRNSAQGAVNQMLFLGAQLDRVRKQVSDNNAAAYADQIEEIEKNGKGASRALRTVVDYANDLRGVFQRINDIKIGRQLTKDEIANAWQNIAEKATDAEDAIRDANAEIQELTADRGVLEYQLSVAQRYGDEKRAAVLRAKLVKIDDKMVDAQNDLKQAQDSANKSLVGNTRAARENRQELAGMVDKYQDYIVALVESGLKGKALADAIDTLKRQFTDQAIAVGYAEDELKPYLDTFDGFKETVQKMPRRVDVEFNSNVSAAQQALNEYQAKLKATAGSYTVEYKLILPKPGSLPMIINPSDYRLYRMGLEQKRLTETQFYKAVYGIDLRAFANGGPVFGPGTSTSDSVPAMLSNGEYVVRARAVRAYGLDFMNSLNRMKPVGSMSNVGGSAIGNGGVTIAQLSPEDRALLRAAVDRPINLYADSKKIAQTANDGNNLIARRGVR